MAEVRNTIKSANNVIMENRKKLMVTGVLDVDSFNEQSVEMKTQLGQLTVRGEGLKVSNFNVEIGEISVEGEIFALVYTDDKPTSGGMLKKLFK